MSLYMESTKIPAEKTAQEISYLLSQAGARQVATDYGDDRKVCGLRFVLEIQGRLVPFSMPVRVKPVYALLQARRSPKVRQRNEDLDLEQAERVAWRQLLRWVQAQLAMIDTGMVEAGEVFFPYMHDDQGRTLWERAIAPGGQLALPPGPTEEDRVKEFKRKG